MKIYTKIAVSLIATVFAIVAVPAQADHDTAGAELSADGLIIGLTCESFGALQYTFDNLVWFANEGKDRPSLQAKLDKSHDKLHEDPPKLCDAAQKLDDFSFKVKEWPVEMLWHADCSIRKLLTVGADPTGTVDLFTTIAPSLKTPEIWPRKIPELPPEGESWDS